MYGTKRSRWYFTWYFTCNEWYMASRIFGANRPNINSVSSSLTEKPDLYLDEMVIFLWDEFEAVVTTSSIRRALVDSGWSKMIAQQKVKEQCRAMRFLSLQPIRVPIIPSCLCWRVKIDKRTVTELSQVIGTSTHVFYLGSYRRE